MNSGRRQLVRIAHFAATIVVALLLADCAAAGPVDSFDDVEFWIGSGSNQAIVAIDWFKDSTDEPALVWGFRWDGMATGQTMLNAVVAADPRLFAKSEGHGALGSAIYGLGYDAGDGEFALDDDTIFDEFGFAASAGPADLAKAVDAGDLYREGWDLGYWHYGLSVGNPYDGGSWKASQTGMTGRTLNYGDWDSWVYTESFSATPFAQNPISAEPPASGDNADFNGDGVVDGGDFLAWQRGFGTIGGVELEHGDANDDGQVDAADLNAWSAAFGTGATPPNVSSPATAVPEPATVSLGVSAALFVVAIARRRNVLNGIAAWK